MCGGRSNIVALRQAFFKLLRANNIDVCKHLCWAFYLVILHKIYNITQLPYVLTQEEDAMKEEDTPKQYPFCADCIATELYKVCGGVKIAIIITSTPDNVRECVYALSRDPENIRNIITNLY